MAVLAADMAFLLNDCLVPAEVQDALRGQGILTVYHFSLYEDTRAELRAAARGLGLDPQARPANRGHIASLVEAWEKRAVARARVEREGQATACLIGQPLQLPAVNLFPNRRCR